MKRPMPPPDLDQLVKRAQPDLLRLLTHSANANTRVADTYLPWDELRYREPPKGLTHEEWWIAVKFARIAGHRQLPLLDKHGRPFMYNLPDQVLQALDAISRDASGQISISEAVTNPATRDRYLVNSLIEEAITSSQLEGAVTSRRVAKEMIRSGREPQTRDERMILNNYMAMQRVRELRDHELSVEMILEIHRIVTDGTLDDPADCGRLQEPGEIRVAVYGPSTDDELFHAPPPADELPDRLQRLCAFANGEPNGVYVPPVVRAMTIHFMLGYDHPFVDGNGRTARVLFYWSMLRQGFWLTEFLTISRILRKAPSKYAKSFLHTEQDDNDLTYFFLYQLHVITRAITDLHEYLRQKMLETHEIQRSLASASSEFNHRQLAVLKRAVEDPDARFTAKSHQTSHQISNQTAHQDLAALEERGLLRRTKLSHQFVWQPALDLPDKLRP